MFLLQTSGIDWCSNNPILGNVLALGFTESMQSCDFSFGFRLDHKPCNTNMCDLIWCLSHDKVLQSHPANVQNLLSKKQG